MRGLELCECSLGKRTEILGRSGENEISLPNQELLEGSNRRTCRTNGEVAGKVIGICADRSGRGARRRSSQLALESLDLGEQSRDLSLEARRGLRVCQRQRCGSYHPQNCGGGEYR